MISEGAVLSEYDKVITSQQNYSKFCLITKGTAKREYLSPITIG